MVFRERVGEGEENEEEREEKVWTKGMMIASWRAHTSLRRLQKQPANHSLSIGLVNRLVRQP